MPLNDAQGKIRVGKIRIRGSFCNLLYSMKYLSVRDKIQKICLDLDKFLLWWVHEVQNFKNS